MNRAALIRSIRADWPEVVRRARSLGFAYPKIQLPADVRLLGTSHKVRLGETLEVETAVIYMSPADESGVNMCAYATDECRASCIGSHTGQLALPMAKLARLWKTALYLGGRDHFKALLLLEARAHVKRAQRLGRVPAIRPNGSTDVALGAWLARRVPELQVYDYTKVPQRMRAERPSNYHLTFSYTGRNDQAALSVLESGDNVAVVFDANPRTREPLPKTWRGYPVLDGDLSDVRFMDAPGHVVGLRFKRAAQRSSFLDTIFVQPGRLRVIH